MSTSTTALMPLDPAVSPEQATRILPIAADLLPQEITAGRNARRVRAFLVVAAVLVAAVMGGWYVYAVKQRTAAADASASADRTVADLRSKMQADKYVDVTKSITTADTLRADLKATLPQDLPWATLLNQLRATAKAKKVTLDTVVATVSDTSSTTASSTATGAAAAIQITGHGLNKKIIADFLQAVPDISAGGVHPLIHAYLTVGTGDATGWTFTMTVDVATAAECGRFTTACKSGGY